MFGENKADQDAMGRGGNVTLTSACGEVAGPFAVLQCLEEVTFTALVDAVEVDAESLGGDDSVAASSLTYAEGTNLFGRFATVEVATGTVRATLLA